MERYEFSEGKSNKFWEIEVEGTGFTVRYGRIGSDGQTKTKSFDSAEKARHEANKLIASKTKKGYAKVATGDAPAAQAEASEAATNPDLEAAITANPDNNEAWQVYADWLQEQGDPRGEAIALELSGDADGAKAIIESNTAHFLGPLAEHQKTYDGEDTDAFGWKRGFVHSLRLSHESYADENFEGKLVDILDALLSHPSGRFLEEITLVFNGDPNEDDQQDLIDLLAVRAPKTLRKLHCGDYDYCGPSDETATGNTEISWYAIGDLSKLWPAVPNLRKLITQCGSSESTISGTGLTLGELDLPKLAHAEFRTGGLETSNVKSIAAARIPDIERLDIWFGDESYGGDSGIDDIAPLLERSDLPKLRRLGLMNALFTDDMVVPVANSSLLKQLEVLDLSMGCLTDEGANRIVEHAGAFAHLKTLEVTENTLSDEAVAALKGALSNVVSLEQREYEEDYRYTAVAE